MKSVQNRLSGLLTRLDDSNIQSFDRVGQKLSAMLEATSVTHECCETELNNAIDELEILLDSKGTSK